MTKRYINIVFVALFGVLFGVGQVLCVCAYAQSRPHTPSMAAQMFHTSDNGSFGHYLQTGFDSAQGDNIPQSRDDRSCSHCDAGTFVAVSMDHAAAAPLLRHTTEKTIFPAQSFVHQTFTYKYAVPQNGTYWYHSHSGLQEQSGHYGPIIIDPKDRDPVACDREYVLVLSDWSFESPHRIFSKLKKMSTSYNFQQRTLGDFIDDVGEKGLGSVCLLFICIRIRPDLDVRAGGIFDGL